MMYDFEKISKEHDNLDVAFLEQLHERITDKENFLKAVDMFVRGLMPLDVATTTENLNVQDFRKEVASNLLKIRAKINREREEAKAKQKKIYEYLGSRCKCFRLLDARTRKVRFAVFVQREEKKIACFMAFDAKSGKGGIHMANIPELLENYNWQPNDALRDLRRVDKRFVKGIKKYAVKEPFAHFDFAPR